MARKLLHRCTGAHARDVYIYIYIYMKSGACLDTKALGVGYFTNFHRESCRNEWMCDEWIHDQNSRNISKPNVFASRGYVREYKSIRTYFTISYIVTHEWVTNSYGWVTSRIWVSHVTSINKSCHTYVEDTYVSIRVYVHISQYQTCWWDEYVMYVRVLWGWIDGFGDILYSFMCM